VSQLVFYRKYRPKLFSEVINQKNVMETLKNALIRDEISHAYLFCGPRGSGKTTVARLLAKSLNCLNRKKGEYEPCNQCASCEAINNNNSLDIIEIDAASNRGIDDIRDLRESIKFAPTTSKYKIYIIDEAHQITKDAFNALLKTLEEPPSYIVFILATTEPEKLPPTILSRLQRYDFRKLGLEDIKKRLALICEKEKITYEDEALRLIALYSEGGLRDAESLLGQIALVSNRNVRKKDVEEIFGLIGNDKVKKFVDLIIKKDKEKAIEAINEIYEEGYDLELFNKNLLSYLRRILLLKISPSLANFIEKEVTDEELKILFKQASAIDFAYLERIIKRLVDVQNQLKRTPIPVLPIEIFLSEELN